MDLASSRYAQIAVQGPKGLATLQKLTKQISRKSNTIGLPMAKFRTRPHVLHALAIPAKMVLKFTSRLPSPRVCELKLLKAGEEFGIKPCGLGARNTLRLEAAMALYGPTDSID